MKLATIMNTALAVCLCMALEVFAHCQVGHAESMNDRVMDILFSKQAPTDMFLTKLTMRFGDTDTQLVVLTYPVFPPHPGGRAEIIKYSIIGTGETDLSGFIRQSIAQKQDITANEIADKLKVNITHAELDYKALQRLMDELRNIRLSPVLNSRVAVDQYSQFDYWYDAGQEFVHYSITGPFRSAAQDQLIQWMIKFRSGLPELEEHSLVPKP